VNDVFS